MHNQVTFIIAVLKLYEPKPQQQQQQKEPVVFLLATTRGMRMPPTPC